MQLCAELPCSRSDVALLAVGLGHHLDEGAAHDGAIGAPVAHLAGLVGAGDAEAQLALGDSYGGREKYGLKRNLELAAQWYRKAAEKGNREAQHKLGICYSFGQGLAQNDAMAAGWYRKAAEAGLAEAQTSLRYCYAHGRGVPLDLEEARLWLTRAGGQGDDNAVSLLKELSVKGAQK